MKEIPGWAFEQTAITHIEIPNSVTYILPFAFRECTKLEDVKFGNSLTSIGGQAFMQTNIKRLILPEPLAEIRELAFSKCDSLTEVTIPRTTIAISDFAFSECPQLKTVHNLATTPQDISYNACPFALCDNPVEVHIYEGLKDLYSTSIGWEIAIDNNNVRLIDDMKALKATSITIDNAPYYCEVGGVGQATATILPENVFTHELSWSSSDESILYIEEFTGQYVGLDVGTVTITASATDGSGVKATAKVYVGQGENGIVDTFAPSTQKDGSIYNLEGQKVQNIQKGIYIINRKKVLK